MESDHVNCLNQNSNVTTLESLQDLVECLYEFRDNFYVKAENSDKPKKWDRVKEEMERVLSSLEEHKNSFSDSLPITKLSHLQYLTGKAYNVMPEFHTRALECLSHAVKLDPSFVDAWNELGECYWKSGNISSAKNCFHCALEKRRNKVSLRNLSITLRQLETKDLDDQRKHCYEGLELAKEAVQLDPTDSESWLILGNSYLAVAFYSPHNAGCLKQALAAYAQAEKYESAQRNADLFYNKAVALIFDERYQEGLENLKQSRELDPYWELPVNKEDSTLRLLRSLQEMIIQKGKLKQRKLNNLLKNISSKDWGPLKADGQKAQKLERVSLQDLKIGINTGKFLLAKVVASVPCEGGSPFVCCVCDSDSHCIAITLYRLASGSGLLIGDSILVIEPSMHLVCVKFNNEVINYQCVRVDSPHTILVNGHPLRPNQMAPMQMVSSTRHE